MLSYRHLYHAGNHADILKHYTLCRILSYLTQKDKPLRYIDTHAGAGRYDLNTSEAQKLQEYNDGIGRIRNAPKTPALVKDYLNLVAKCGSNNSYSYPGSPWLAAQLLRPYDRLELCELHPQDFPRLEKTMSAFKNSHCYDVDGFQKSASLLPPVERRGVVFIDPSYELKQDYSKVADHLQVLTRKFSTGVYAIWYPIVNSDQVARLHRAVRKQQHEKIACYELSVTADEAAKGMRGSGMIVINPPWSLTAEVTEFLEFAAPLVATDGGSHWRALDTL